MAEIIKRNIVEQKIIENFSKLPFFDREELYAFYLMFEPELNRRTFGWRVFDLKKKNIIESIKRGIYRISNKKLFIPAINNTVKKINSHFKKYFFEMDYIIWTTEWINNLSLHMTFGNFYIVEVYQENTEMVFEKLKELGIGDVYLQPNDKTIYNYVIEGKKSIIIKSLITRAPIKKINKIPTPSLEKILVDLFCDQKVFYMYQGNELEKIFQDAFVHYIINITKILNYADRRGRKEDLINYLKSRYSNLLEGFI